MTAPRPNSFPAFLTLALLLATLTGCAAPPRGKPSPETAQNGVRLRGYDFDVKNFFDAVRGGDHAAVADFLAGGMDPNSIGPAGDSALAVAASKNDVTGLRTLLSGGANVNLKPANGDTALVRAARVNAQESIRFLLDQKADPNVPGAAGNTVLQFFVDNNDEPLIHAAL